MSCCNGAETTAAASGRWNFIPDDRNIFPVVGSDRPVEAQPGRAPAEGTHLPWWVWVVGALILLALAKRSSP